MLTQPAFIYLYLLSVIAIYVFFLIDRWTLRKGFLATLGDRVKKWDALSSYIMRVSGAIFFIILAAWFWTHARGFYLTPELATSESWVPWLTLTIGLCALYSRTTFVTGTGILVLYAASLYHYGLFHMIDYVIFLGIAYFYLTNGRSSSAWKKSSFIVLFATTGLTLCWASIEKFAYPQWTTMVLTTYPAMTMGLSSSTFITLTGFCEFTATFILLGAASVLGRMVAFGLQSVFVLAIFQFGELDAIGHLMFIAIFLVLFLRGPTSARNMLVLENKSLFTEAYFMTGLYHLALVFMFLAFYGLHFILFTN